MKIQLCLSLLSFSAITLAAGNTKAQTYGTYEECINAAWENLVACSNEAASDSTANMWGTALGGAAMGAAMGATGTMGAGAAPGAAGGFLMGGAGAAGVELIQQGQCVYTYLSQRSECSSSPESNYPQQPTSSHLENVIELSPVYIYPEGDPRNFQYDF